MLSCCCSKVPWSTDALAKARVRLRWCNMDIWLLIAINAKGAGAWQANAWIGSATNHARLRTRCSC